MRVAILARGHARPGGVGRLVSGYLRSIPPASPEDEFFAITDTPLGGQFKASNLEEIILGKHNPAVFDHLLAGRAARRVGADVFLATKNTVPLGLSCPAVCVYLDLAYFAMPESYGRLDNFYMRAMFRRSARRAARIVAISESTGRDVGRFLGADAQEKTRVVYPGIDERFKPLTAEKREEARRRFAELPERFVLYAGNISPRKNLRRLIDAFEQLDEKIGLVLTGHREWGGKGLKEALEAVASRRDVRVLGGLPDGDLAALYGIAEASVYPSLYEGFGFPVLESMACGTPVAASRAASIPEAAGDAAVMFDPCSTQEMAKALGQVLSMEGPLRRETSARGMERARQFSWGRCADGILEVLREVA